MKSVLLLLMLTAVFLSASFISPNKARACSCAEPTVEKRFESSSAVFTGTVTGKDGEGGNFFSVDTIWKGQLADGYVYSGFFGMCGTEFEQGQTYLVFTEKLKDKESTSLCSGNKLISEAGQEIQVLNRITAPVWTFRNKLLLLAGFAVVAWIIILRKKLRLR